MNPSRPEEETQADFQKAGDTFSRTAPKSYERYLCELVSAQVIHPLCPPFLTTGKRGPLFTGEYVCTWADLKNGNCNSQYQGAK